MKIASCQTFPQCQSCTCPRPPAQDAERIFSSSDYAKLSVIKLQGPIHDRQALNMIDSINASFRPLPSPPSSSPLRPYEAASVSIATGASTVYSAETPAPTGDTAEQPEKLPRQSRRIVLYREVEHPRVFFSYSRDSTPICKSGRRSVERSRSRRPTRSCSLPRPSCRSRSPPGRRSRSRSRCRRARPKGCRARPRSSSRRRSRSSNGSRTNSRRRSPNRSYQRPKLHKKGKKKSSDSRKKMTRH